MAEWSGEEKLLEKVLEIDCPSCASKLYYSAEHKMLRCNHCGYKEEFSRENGEVVEVDLKEALLQLGEYIPESIGRQIYDCAGCSAKFAVDAGQPRIVCAFCGSENVNLEAFEHKYVKPSGILPFCIPRAEAVTRFQKWIRSGWFHPNSLKHLAELDNLHGVYIPFWTFDAQTSNEWSGEAGYYYYETVQVKVNGQWQTKQVQKTRWVYKSGSFDHFFDDVVVSASANLKQTFLDRILPFELPELVNFDPRLLVGWESEIYSVELDQGWERGDKIIDQQLYYMAMNALGGDTQRGLTVKSQKSDQTFKHIMLPIWLASYRYKNKIFRFVINGQNAKVYGEKPISWWKIGLLILAFLAVVAAIYFYREANVG